MGGTSTDVCRFSGEFELSFESVIAEIKIACPQLLDLPYYLTFEIFFETILVAYYSTLVAIEAWDFLPFIELEQPLLALCQHHIQLCNW